MGRQVLSYFIVGQGRLAKHLAFYLPQFNCNVVNPKITHNQFIEDDFDYYLLAINDDALKGFIESNKHIPKHKWITFSGACVLDKVKSFHPLMTFGHDLYPIETYLKTPFICQSQSEFFETFPMLSNPVIELPNSDRAFYHMLLTLCGNGTTFLLQTLLQELNNRYQMSSSIVAPFINQIIINSFQNPSKALTGVWVRGDQDSIAKHLCALNDHKLKSLYQSFSKVVYENK